MLLPALTSLRVALLMLALLLLLGLGGTGVLTLRLSTRRFLHRSSRSWLLLPSLILLVGEEEPGWERQRKFCAEVGIVELEHVSKNLGGFKLMG
jgi:hypothetical protein